MPSWLKRVRTIFRRGSMERELDIELQFHLDMLAADYVRRGIPPDAARRSARQTFGGVESIKDSVRDAWLTRLVETIGQDVRYGLRGLRRQAGYALAVIVTMALGIGANTAIFSVVNAVVLRPLPYDRGEDLLLLNQARTNVANTGFSFADIDDIKALSGSLDAVVEYHNMYFILLGGEEPERVAAGVVSWDYFQTLGITPLVGRVFRAEDDGHDKHDKHDKHDTQATLVLSHEYWQRAFRGDRTVVGRVVEMNDRPHTIVGVLPDVPMYPQPNDVYMPRSACPFRMNATEQDRRGSGMASALGRRRPGQTLEDAQSDLAAVGQRLQQTHPKSYPAERGYQLTATPLRREFTRNFESTLLILVSTAGFVLLIVCASVANLAVARTMRRDRELALRTALGASQGRLLRQLATESLILALVGGACGLLLAFVGMDLLVQYAGRFTPRATEVRIDTAVLLFTLGVSLLTGIIAALLPAVSRRLGPRRAAISAGPRRLVHRSDLRRALIVAQVAASFVLLIGAGLMVRSLMKLTGVDPGFSSDHVLTMQIDMNFTKYRTLAERAAYLDRLLIRLQQIPGVAAVGASGTIPFLEEAGGALNSLLVTGRAGQKSDDTASAPRAALMIASDDYFRAMDIRLIRGRFFAPTDTIGSPGVALVNRTFAARNWPEEDPVGQRVSSNGGRTWFTIVGIVADVRQQLALEPVDEIYAPMRQMPYVTTNWVIRSTVDPVVLDSQVREAVRDTDRDQPIHRLRTLDDVRAASLAPPRLTTTLLGLFAALALIITAAGIAGVIAFSVSQRTQEFGVRVALGAKRSDVVSMVVGEGVRLAITGLAIGLVGAVILGGLLSTVLFGIGPVDAVTYLAVSMVLLAVAGLACLLPALRAASIDPMTALRTV
jgi:predicted permease